MTSPRIFILAFVLLGFLHLSVLPGYCDSIQQFNSDITLLPNGIVRVSEDFQIDFSGKQLRRRIYRSIPIEYVIGEGLHRVDIHLQNVTLDGESPSRSSAWAAGDVFQISIGEDEKHFLGKHKFHLEYEIRGGVNYLFGGPQLFINVTGDDWPFPIEKASATLHLPKGVDTGKVKGQKLVGLSGQFRKSPLTSKNDEFFVSSTSVPAGQGLNLSVDMPAGSVVLPSVLQDVIWHLQVSYQAICLPLATMLLLSFFWNLFGRDQKPGKEQDGGIRPPEYLSAAEVGTLIDERCDLIDVVSTVIDLAVRGFIRIRVLPFNGFLYLSNRDYEFRLLKSPKDRELKPHEQLFLVAMFGLSDTTYLSAIKGNFAEYLPTLRRRIYASLVTGGYFARDPEVDRRQFVSVGLAVLVCGVGLLAASEFHITGRATAIGVILSGLVIALAASTMPKRKAAGTRALKQIIAFRNFVAFGKKEELSKLAGKEPDLFSKYLPYAIVLGLADRWAVIFQKQIKEYPNWYQVDPHLEPACFSSIRFVSDLGEGVQVINKAFTEQASVLSKGGYSIDDYVRDSDLNNF